MAKFENYAVYFLPHYKSSVLLIYFLKAVSRVVYTKMRHRHYNCESSDQLVFIPMAIFILSVAPTTSPNGVWTTYPPRHAGALVS